ncbi:hypothetical protein CBFG_00719 [Clostridiales bacterium 1_7_47FAA]|nr:hypothetical protein CBFG_00719 [Clostridiales bacterium 1_7_47FAA]
MTAKYNKTAFGTLLLLFRRFNLPVLRTFPLPGMLRPSALLSSLSANTIRSSFLLQIMLSVIIASALYH